MAMFGMTDEKKSLLIQEIYRRPLIWKVSDPQYTDVPARWVAFEEIARELTDDELSFTSDMIKVAWKNMMDYYNQIRRRHDRAVAAGLVPPESKWQFYNMMHFTKQDKPPVKRKYNWMEPSKIALNTSVLNTYSSEDYNLYLKEYIGDVNLPKPIPIRPKSLDSSRAAPQNIAEALTAITATVPRTKESERARIRARRAALKETNIADIMGTPTKESERSRGQSRNSPKKVNLQNVKKEVHESKSPESDKEATRPKTRTAAKRNNRGQFVKYETTVVNSVSRSGRSRQTRRYSISPPPRSPRKSASSACRASNSKQTSRKRTVSSPRKPSVPVSSPGAVRPLANFDSTSIFARSVAARLYVIKSHSPHDYLRACQQIDKVLKEAESEVGISNSVGNSA